MKTEIDVDNKDGKLTSGMYGKVTINLTSGTRGPFAFLRSLWSARPATARATFTSSATARWKWPM